MAHLPDLWFDPTKCFVNGTWVAPTNGEQLALTNPSTGEDIGKYINEHLLPIEGIERSLTTMTFKAF